MSGAVPPPVPEAPVVLPEPGLPPAAPLQAATDTVTNTDTDTDTGKVPEGWEGIMQPGERILWRGRPIARPQVLRVGLNMTFGALFAGFALFWMAMAATGGGYFWMFGLSFFAVGLGMVAKPLLDERMRLRDTFFTLSDRAAYIARRHWMQGRQLETHRITAAMPITLNGHPAKGDVIFASRTVRNKNGSHEVPIGFLDIEDAPEVFALMTQARDALR